MVLVVILLVIDHIESTSLGLNCVSSIKPLMFGLNQNKSICICILCILKLHCIFKFSYTPKNVPTHFIMLFDYCWLARESAYWSIRCATVFQGLVAGSL